MGEKQKMKKDLDIQINDAINDILDEDDIIKVKIEIELIDGTQISSQVTKPNKTIYHYKN
jgi:hypothetical protein